MIPWMSEQMRCGQLKPSKLRQPNGFPPVFLRTVVHCSRSSGRKVFGNGHGGRKTNLRKCECDRKTQSGSSRFEEVSHQLAIQATSRTVDTSRRKIFAHTLGQGDLLSFISDVELTSKQYGKALSFAARNLVRQKHRSRLATVIKKSTVQSLASSACLFTHARTSLCRKPGLSPVGLSACLFTREGLYSSDTVENLRNRHRAAMTTATSAPPCSTAIGSTASMAFPKNTQP